MTPKTKKILVWIGVIVIILLVANAIYTAIYRADKIAVDVNLVPSDAKMVIGKETYGQGTAYIKAGSYDVEISKKGFETYKIKLDVQEGAYVNVPLTAVSAEAKKWADQNQTKYLAAESLGGKRASEEGALFTEKNPITKKIPFKDPYFSIGYKRSGDSILITVLTSSPRYRYSAIQQIRSWGYDPTNYDIEFRDFKNPLGDV